MVSNRSLSLSAAASWCHLVTWPYPDPHNVTTMHSSLLINTQCETGWGGRSVTDNTTCSKCILAETQICVATGDPHVFLMFRTIKHPMCFQVIRQLVYWLLFFRQHWRSDWMTSFSTSAEQLLVTKHRRDRLTENRSDASSRGKVLGLQDRHRHGGPYLIWLK